MNYCIHNSKRDYRTEGIRKLTISPRLPSYISVGIPQLDQKGTPNRYEFYGLQILPPDRTGFETGGQIVKKQPRCAVVNMSDANTEMAARSCGVLEGGTAPTPRSTSRSRQRRRGASNR